MKRFLITHNDIEGILFSDGSIVLHGKPFQHREVTSLDELRRMFLRDRPFWLDGKPGTAKLPYVEQFGIRQMDSDLEVSANLQYRQLVTLEQFAALCTRICDTGCTLESASYLHDLDTEFLNRGTTREHLTHTYTVRALVSAQNEDDLERLKSRVARELSRL